MKSKLSICLSAFICYFIFCGKPLIAQGGYWTWIKGDSLNCSAGNFGVQGVAHPLNNPPAVYEPCEWTANDGTFWMFGGADTSGSFYGDLWKYDPLTNMWTWMKGTGVKNDPGNPGTMGVPDISNLPAARALGIPSWVDANGNFWMYGGRSSFMNYDHGDLWKYEIATNTWTWMSGSSGNTFPVYGIAGVASPLNQPGSRAETSATWVDSDGKLWFFGGFRILSLTMFGDLWKYDPDINQWTWYNGTDNASQFNSSLGLGIADSSNIPSARIAYCTWKDNSENFWMFGGARSPFGGKYFNDVWKYNRFSGMWTWMDGPLTFNDGGQFGPTCSVSGTYMPSCRYETRARWTDMCGNLIFYRGAIDSGNVTYARYNDLWFCNTQTLEWTVITGTSQLNLNPVYGVQGSGNFSNTPGSRRGSISWMNSAGELFLFGGYGWSAADSFKTIRNDLWKFTIDTTCVPVCLRTSDNELTSMNIGLFPNPASTHFTVSATEYINHIELYDQTGKVIYSSEVTRGQTQVKIQRSAKWISGIYFVRIKTQNNTFTGKLFLDSLME